MTNYFLKIRFIVIELIQALILLSSCDTGNKLNNFNIDTSNALRVIINFETRKESASTINYWKADQPGRVFSKETKLSKRHKIALFNLKPDTRYNYVIKTYDSSQSVISDTSFFKTKSYQSPLHELNLMIDSGDVFNGYILLRRVEGYPRQLIINNQGKIIWYQELDSAVTRFYSWTDSNTILSLNTEDEIQESDIEGNLIFELKLGEKGFTKHLHHEIIKDKMNNIISLTRNMRTFDLSEFNGTKEDTVYSDGILVLDSIGNKIWEWDIYQHLNPLEDKDIGKMKKDWSHGNALAIDLDGNYLISFRNFHQIWKIDSKSGDIKWKFGLKGDFLLKPEDLFYSQHSVFINKFNELMFFDNGMPGTYSRAISFKIESDSLAIPGKINVRLPASLYTVKEGSAYLIGKEKILFCSTLNNMIVIMNTKGNILWELNTLEPIYRAYYLEDKGLFNN